MYLVLVSIFPDAQGSLVELVALDVFYRFREALGACHTEILERLLVALEMVIDTEALIVLVQRPELFQEWQILAGILGDD